eukprot:COSAG02_NODE_16714_length_1061_cov_166.596674_1_plen_32_part_10
MQIFTDSPTVWKERNASKATIAQRGHHMRYEI